MFKKIFILFFASAISNAYALSYHTFKYTVEKNDSFASVLKKFVIDTAIINAKTPLTKKTIKENPNIKDWNHLPANEIIRLSISDNFLDLEKYKAYQSKMQYQENVKITAIANNREFEKNKPAPDSYPTGIKGSVFTMSSLGNYEQKANNESISFQQNSPMTLGGAFSYYTQNKLYSFSTSVYLSYLSTSVNSQTTGTISPPLEKGGNFYGEYRTDKYNMTFYSGLDLENFSALNLRSFQLNNKVYLDSITASYLTLGVTRPFTLFNKKFFTKISVSKSLMTTYKSADQNAEKYSGSKFLFYLNYKLNDKFYLHSLIKYHTMSGPSDLTIFRIGVGVGYNLF